MIKNRCRWAEKADPIYVKYHDEEWGREVKDDQQLFERISLEGMQSGLSWITVLRKREDFRKAFFNFDIDKVAQMEEEKTIPELLKNEKLIRSERKLLSIIRNARLVQKMKKEGLSLTQFLWSFAPENPFKYTGAEPVAQTEESVEMSKALKKKGFSYIGPVICYALMQATGMVQDHLEECDFHRKKLK